MSDENKLLLQLHPCAKGLDDQTLDEIAQSAELVRFEANEMVCNFNEPNTSVYLIIHGRLQITARDDWGRPVMQRIQSAGSQFGGIAASLADPVPLECKTVDPSVLLRLDYSVALQLTKKHDQFRANFSRIIGNSLKEALLNKRSARPAKLVVFFHQTDETRLIRDKILQRLIELDEELSLLTDHPTAIPNIRQYPKVGSDNELSPDETRQKVAQDIQTGRVIADLPSDFDPERATRALLACEQVFWFVTPANWQASIAHLRRLESRAKSWRHKVHLVWLLKTGEEVPIATELRRLCNRDFKICFEAPDANHSFVLTSGFDRLIQFLRGIQIGIALGGGAARGMAHLGVLKALQQGGITVDMMAGTSAGAMTGTLYASGLDPDFLVQQFMNDLRPPWMFRCLPRGDQWYLLYKYRRRHFDPMLRRYLRDLQIEQLAIPMHTITVDLIQGKALIRDSGDAVQGIVESINLPVLSKPIIRGWRSSR